MAAEFADPRQDGMQHERRGGVDAQAPGRGLAVHRQALFHLVHLLQDQPSAFEEEATLLGQVHAPSGAVDQRGTQLALKARQGTADSGRGLAHLLGSSGNRAAVDDGDEYLEFFGSGFHICACGWSLLGLDSRLSRPSPAMPVRASSRVNPLPQVLRGSQRLWDTCGSGFTREEASTGKTLLRLAEHLVQMRLIGRQSSRHIRPLHHIHRQESRQPGHAEELVGLVEREVHRVHPLALEEVARVVECLLRCIPGKRKHVLLAMHQATAAVLLRMVRTGTAVVGIQAAVACGEHFIDVLLHGPWRTHPPAGHLVDDHIGPEELLHLFLGVVTTVDEGLAHIETGPVQVSDSRFVQSRVEATVGVSELFTTVEQKDLLHAGLAENSGRQVRGSRARDTVMHGQNTIDLKSRINNPLLP
ncbi:protein of unknown function [Pseudomonas inefficax]|uniref:Uncharacterized protein n=1 Tax=Pseudomonas inefficax TaxID=2078786 RepID=A0AAQ1PC97_9PSED|nr:protein of unknown function [Pseudomonas inefficax]